MADSVAFDRQWNMLGRGGPEAVMENETPRIVRARRRMSKEVRRHRSRASVKGIKMPSYGQLIAIARVKLTYRWHRK